MALLPPAPESACGAISMPDNDDPALLKKAAELRAAGEIVINTLGTSADARCDRELVEVDGVWEIKKL